MNRTVSGSTTLNVETSVQAKAIVHGGPERFLEMAQALIDGDDNETTFALLACHFACEIARARAVRKVRGKGPTAERRETDAEARARILGKLKNAFQQLGKNLDSLPFKGGLVDMEMLRDEVVHNGLVVTKAQATGALRVSTAAVGELT
jgi:hypothetical protein